jgi:CubicO group peptidase (beta-lactamase class C family)
MDQTRLQEMLDTSIEEQGFSGVVSIRQHDAVIYERAAGYADRSNKVENTLDTRFGIASGTKFFTALAIGKLIEAGKLSLSTKLKDCVALSFPHYSPEITIGHLLTNTSGIPDYLDEEKITDFDNFSIGIPWYEVKGPRDYLPAFPDEPMKFAPGERFSYSNGGYILLGVVIEELTGMRYQDFVEQSVFKPVGIDRSGYFAFNKLPEKTAFGYVEEENGWRTNIYNLPIIGASDGGAYTTVHDVATLWKAFWEYRILPKELVDIYSRPHIRTDTEREDVYYGHSLWLIARDGQSSEVSFSGADAGVSFDSIVYRDSGLLVTVISNTSNGAWPILKNISTILKGE